MLTYGFTFFQRVVFLQVVVLLISKLSQQEELFQFINHKYCVNFLHQGLVDSYGSHD